MNRLFTALVLLCSACSEPAPPVRDEPPIAPPPGPELGSSHPLIVHSASAHGRWVAVCRTTTDTDGDGDVTLTRVEHGELYGDALSTALFFDDGRVIELEDLVAVDPQGRFVAGVRSGALTLIDTQQDELIELSDADIRDVAHPFGPHRAGSFDAAGTLFHYVVGNEVRIRSLSDGTEHRITVPDGSHLWRAHLDPGGAYAWLELVHAQGDSGDVVWPQRWARDNERACNFTEMATGDAWELANEPTRVVARIADGEQFDAPGGIALLGDELVSRRDRAIVGGVVGVDPTVRLPASCEGHLFAIDPERESAYFGCRGEVEERSVPLHRVHAGGVERFPLRAVDPYSWIEPLMTRPYVQCDSGALDVVSGEPVPLEPGDRVLALTPDWLLVSSGALVHIDRASQTRRVLGDVVPQFSSLQAGVWAAVRVNGGDVVLRLDKPSAMTRSEHDVEAVTEDGLILTHAPAGGRVPNGPLVWRSALARQLRD